jgi:hypothetical protein
MIVPVWPLRARQRWFAEPDGSGYYRNCPLIMAEWKAALHLGRVHLALRLQDEWIETFRRGVTRKDKLDRHDILATPAPFREAYPQYPGLWALDHPQERS